MGELNDPRLVTTKPLVWFAEDEYRTSLNEGVNLKVIGDPAVNVDE